MRLVLVEKIRYAAAAAAVAEQVPIYIYIHPQHACRNYYC